MSAARHTTAQNNCLEDFFPNESGSSGEGQTLCNILPWVNVGIMSGLWVVLGILFVSGLLVVWFTSDIKDRYIFGLWSCLMGGINEWTTKSTISCANPILTQPTIPSLWTNVIHGTLVCPLRNCRTPMCIPETHLPGMFMGMFGKKAPQVRQTS